MEEITFHHDTVLSDVHMLRPGGRHLMTHLNSVGQPVFMSRLVILAERCDSHEPGSDLKQESETSQTVKQATDEPDGEDRKVESLLDVDGDLDIIHRPQPNLTEGSSRDWTRPVVLKQSNDVMEQEDEGHWLKDVIRIEHTMATPMEDVGKQVWRGALFMVDFILSNPVMFRGATVLELGAGTGLTSIIMATIAKTVYCTDVGEDLLQMCKRNIALNKHMLKSADHEVKVRQLDWLQDDLCTDVAVEFSWTKEEVADLNNTSIIIAADVCYDDDLTDGLFRTLYRLCSNFPHTCTIFISIEKRMNFTLQHMDVSCEAYDHFVHCMNQLQDLENGQCSFRVEQLPSNFDQFILYERVEQLELWKVTATPLPFKQARSDPEAF
ncbi:methyltransferase-like protein 22 [Oreochromis aureus]|uniref:Methyltransferase like 22 n=1 Tax=Oreochromis aureus TaxID=47969 RepID=A0AAZ1XUS3_OREAU|nr:methyltransferase-like protein 22 [Oreochromis aureus]XP_039467079.1 methyltransferase-like protein 22 [Oreochromis aureus]